jgi:phosphoglycolate phosphatase
MPTKAEAVFLDFDGVFVNSRDFHHQKLQEFLGKHIPLDVFLTLHDGNFYQRAEQMEIPWLKDVSWPEYRDFIYPYQADWVIDPVTKMVLLYLGSAYRLFIVSSTGTININQFLASNGLRNLFLEVLGGDRMSGKTEKLRRICRVYGFLPNRCLYVTDTLGDLHEANEAGMPSLAVTFGYHDRKRLERGHPFRFVFHPVELIGAVKSFESFLKAGRGA